ncbi:MAG: helix-turn-helix transcriptional regulator [Lutibacter sp.]|jgi:DNA-binding CsgD family transcriptional regulator|nr:helix-turn-helix transcriptional regulator [Lutibacter sp.]
MKKLTVKEANVAHLIANGFTEYQIAGLLSISPHTVHHHTKNIHKKWSARNKADITRQYILSLKKPRDVLKDFETINGY